MPSSFQLTAIHLRVADLGRSLEFYLQKLGFTLAHQSESHADLSASIDTAPFLMLSEAADAPTAPPDAAGLFHFAILFPDRVGLGGWLQYAAAQSVDFEGFSDHGVSEAIYLSDPDGNGLEFYTDRRREMWPMHEGELAMTTRPLDVRSLLTDAVQTGPTVLAGAGLGHLHLRVTNLARSETFYRHQLGLETTQRSYPGARFMAADNYHHHLGLNTWGAPSRPQPAGSLGLAEATFSRAGAAGESRLVDPDGIHLRVQPALVPA